MGTIIQKMKNEIISRSNAFEEKTRGTKDEYNLYREHVQYVYKYAIMIAKEKNVDLEVVELSALLHDIAMTDESLDRTRHNEYGAEIVVSLLKNENYPEDKIEKVRLCVLNHSSKRKGFRTMIEEQVLVDADAMAHFDCINSLYSLAYNVMGLCDIEAREFVKEKLTRDYNEISDDVRKFVSDKYEEVMNWSGNHEDIG